MSPLVAVQTAVWPLAYDVIDGARPSGSCGSDSCRARLAAGHHDLSELEGRIGAGIRWGVLSSTAYGLGVLLGGLTSEASGMWSVVANRSTNLIVAIGGDHDEAAGAHPPRTDLPRCGSAGSPAAWPCCAFVYGTQRYDLAMVGVTGSLFPAVSAYLMYRFLGHPLRWWQASGSPACSPAHRSMAVG